MGGSSVTYLYGTGTSTGIYIYSIGTIRVVTYGNRTGRCTAIDVSGKVAAGIDVSRSTGNG